MTSGGGGVDGGSGSGGDSTAVWVDTVMCGEWTVWVPADLGLAALVCTAIVLRVE